MVQKITTTDDFPDGILILVGRIAIRFGQLEHLMALTVKRLLGKGFDEGMALAEKLQTVSALSERAKELYAARRVNQGEEAEFEAALAHIRCLYQQRHEIIHALWGMDKNGRIVRIKGKKNLGVKEAELEKLREEVSAAAVQLDRFTRSEGFKHASPQSEAERMNAGYLTAKHTTALKVSAKST